MRCNFCNPFLHSTEEDPATDEKLSSMENGFRS